MRGRKLSAHSRRSRPRSSRRVPVVALPVMAGVVMSFAGLTGGSQRRTEARPILRTRLAFPADSRPDAAVPAATFRSWFASGSPTLNGRVLPANSVTFSAGQSGVGFGPANDAAFYRWAYQMFLWLTSPTGGGEYEFSSPTFFDVSPIDSHGQRFFIAHTPGQVLATGVPAGQVEIGAMVSAY